MKKQISIQLLLFSIFMALNNASAFDNIKIQGFISQGYLKSTANNFYADTEDGTFEFNEVGINFTTQTSDKLHMGIQFFARDLGRLDNDKPTINWAYGDYKLKDYIGIRAGIIKLSYGLYNEIRDMDLLRPNILYPYGVYNESWRDVTSSITGVGIYGNIPIGFLGKLRYMAQDGVNNITPGSGASDLLEDQVAEAIPGSQSSVKKAHLEHLYNACCFWETPFSIDGLKIGFSGFDLYFEAITDITFSSIGLYDQVLSVDNNTICFSLEYVFGDFTFASEYIRYRWNLVLAGTKVPEHDAVSYYFNFTYSLSDNIEVYTAYSVYYGDNDDKNGNDIPIKDQEYRGWLKEVIYAVRFDINDNWIFKLETHIADGSALLLNMDQGPPEPDDESGHFKYPYKKEWLLFAAKLSYYF